MTIQTSASRTSALSALGYTDNPFVAWNNLAASATLGGTATLTDGAAANAVTGTTYDYWLPNVTATTANFQVTFGAARTLSCVAIAAHNLFTLAGTVQVQRSIDAGATWSAASSAVTPTDNKPIVFRMVTSGNDAADWRLRFTNLTAGAPLQVGVAFFGDDLVFPQRFYQGFSPVITPTEVQLQSNVSVGGNLLGATVVRKGSTLQAPFKIITPSFIRSDMAGFMPHFNAGKGVFFAWRPATYVDDVYYGWRNGDVIRPANADARDYMAFTLSMQTHEP